MKWSFKEYSPAEWEFLRKHNSGMNHAFGVAREDFWRHELGEREKMMAPVIVWCREQFGEPFTGVWSHSSSWVLFADIDRAFEFKIRWG